MSQLSDLTGTTAFLDAHPYVDTALKATGFGAGAYATMALVREVLDALEDRKAERRRNKPTIGKDTIVVTLPNTVKGASAREAILEYAKVHRKPIEDEDPRSKVRQARNADGTFARGYDVTLSKDAENKSGGIVDEVVDTGLDIAGASAGTAVGWLLTQRVHDFLKQKRLKREIAAAQKEYIDTLMPKAAETPFVQDYSGLTPASSGPVTPESPLANRAKQFAGGVFGLSLLLAAASSIITKKWLDDRFKDPSSQANKPKVKNIVFKTASGGPPLECDAVDVLAYSKLASIAMCLPIEKSAETGVMDAVKRYQDPANAWGDIFEDIGMPGNDQNGWSLSLDPKPEGSRQLAWLPFLDTAPVAQREAFQNEFMSDKWAKKRQFIAQNMVNGYLNQYNNSGFGKTWMGQLLSPLFAWIGNGISSAYAGTPWGQRSMFNQIQNRVKARAGANPVAGSDSNPFAGSDFE